VKPGEFKDKKLMVVDRGGLFVSWAFRFSEEFGEVYYHNPAWKEMESRTDGLLVGHGFDEITMVKNFWDVAHQMDIFVFPWVGDGDWQLELVRQGKRVWGARKGEDLELYRSAAKEEFRKLGMPVNDYTVITGITNLRVYLKNHPNVFIKINLTRGDGDTFHSPSYDEILPKLREIEHDLDQAAESVEFIVEKPISTTVENGYDGYCIDGLWPKYAISGVEIKECAYVGAFIPANEFDESIKKVNAWLSPALKQYGYRGPLHTEIRIGRDEQPYLIDLTARYGSPPSESMQESIANWAEIAWYGSEGVMVNPEPVKKYSAQAIINSDHAIENWQSLKLDDDLRKWVKLRFHCKISGVDYVIPQMCRIASIGWVVGIGDTVKEAITNCKDHAERLGGYKVEVMTDGLEKAVEEIEKGERMGVQFSDEPIS